MLQLLLIVQIVNYNVAQREENEQTENRLLGYVILRCFNVCCCLCNSVL